MVPICDGTMSQGSGASRYLPVIVAALLFIALLAIFETQRMIEAVQYLEFIGGNIWNFFSGIFATIGGEISHVWNMIF